MKEVRFVYSNCVIDGWINDDGELTDKDGVILRIAEPLEHIYFLNEPKEENFGFQDVMSGELGVKESFNVNDFTTVPIKDVEIKEPLKDVELSDEATAILMEILESVT